MRELGHRRFKEALRDPGRLGAFWFALGSPALVELSLSAEPDAVVIDLQHGLWDRGGLEAVLGLIPPSVHTIVRLADGSAPAIGQALDAGAEAVLAPLIETVEAARACVEAAHYPPHGCRSGGGLRPLGRGFASYVAEARARTAVGIMIETARGVENASAIAAVPGLDFVFIGTGDLALSLGCFPGPDERLPAACRRVLKACRTAGVPCGLFTTSATEAADRSRDGYALTVVANDIGIVSHGFGAALSGFAAAAS